MPSLLELVLGRDTSGRRARDPILEDAVSAYRAVTDWFRPKTPLDLLPEERESGTYEDALRAIENLEPYGAREQMENPNEWKYAAVPDVGLPEHPVSRWAALSKRRGAASIGEMERAALKDYMNGDIPVNPVLRGDLARIPGPHIRGEAERVIPHLDSYFKQAPPTPEPITVYRGVRGDVAENYKKLKPGDVIDEPGYVSTTVHPEKTGQFGNVQMRIKVPEGTPAIPGDSLEYELLLPRGRRFKVVGVDNTDAGRVLDVELLK